MTEIGEGAAVNRIADDHDPATCLFCQQAPPVVRENVFRDDPTVFTERLARPDARRLQRSGEEDLVVAAVAHHLIPGAQALQRSTLATSGRHLRSDGAAAGNIGYDVNRAANGVWVPNAAHPPAAAAAVIDLWQAQSHAAHESYDELVRDALDRLHTTVQRERLRCPHASASTAEPGALTVLVQRLDALSARLRRLVRFPASGWKAEVFLSRASRQYMIDHQVGGD